MGSVSCGHALAGSRYPQLGLELRWLHMSDVSDDAEECFGLGIACWSEGVRAVLSAAKAEEAASDPVALDPTNREWPAHVIEDRAESLLCIQRLDVAHGLLHREVEAKDSIILKSDDHALATGS
jgi:hypothetical protein